MIRLLQRLERHAPRLAIEDEEGAFTYAELLAAAERVAAGIVGELGARRDDEPGVGPRIAFRVPPGFGHVATLLGIWRAGAVAVPLALSHPERELEHAIGDAEASLLIDEGGASSPLAALAAAKGLVRRGWRELAGDALPAPPGAERAAILLYTSGSTGRPKGVVHTHAGIAAQIESLVEAWGWSAADRIPGILPLHHVHGIVNVLLSSLWSGALWRPLPRFDAAVLWRHLESARPTLLMAVPTIYRRLVDHWRDQPPARRRELARAAARLRLAVSGSAALPVPLFDQWREIAGDPLLERYGMTEIGMALSNPLAGERRPGFVGTPLPGVEVRRAGEDGRLVHGAEPGELEVRGPGVFRRYWRRPEATREAFRDGWFRTGDVAVVERGAYRILGRMSVDIVKTGGYKVSALEIESAFAEHPAIAEIAVVGVADAEWGERLCAAIVPRGGAPTLDELRAWGRERLAPYKLPRELLVVLELPRNALGKVVKPRLAERFTGRSRRKPEAGLE